MKLEMEVEGTRTMMVIDEFVQTTCLEFSLARKLDELEGLKDLETLDVTHLAHRIGMAEVHSRSGVPGTQPRGCTPRGHVDENHPGAV